MKILDEIREHKDFARFLRMFSFTVCVWILGLCVMGSAMSVSAGFKERMSETSSVISAAQKIMSAPSYGTQEKEPITEISEIASDLGIKEGISQLGVSPSGLVFEVGGLDTESFSKLVSTISERGFSVKSCEARVLSLGKKSPSIKATFVIGADPDENTGNS